MDHVRIDEGFKRGKRKAKMPQRTNANPRNERGQYLPLLPQDDESIRKAVEQYRDGMTCEQIAEQHGVSIQAIYSWLLAELGGEQHQRLVTQALTARIALADYRLDTAPTPLELARAREQCRNSRQDLERRRSNLYGPKQEITHTQQPILNIQINVAPQQPVEIAQIEHGDESTP